MTNSNLQPRRIIGLIATLLATSVGVGACADIAPEADDSELGVFSFALTGVIPGVEAMEVKVYDGPVTSMDKVHKFELGCIPYLTGADKSNNAFTLDLLPARDDYSVLVNLYADAACKDLVVRGYRGGIQVKPGTRPDVATAPYYIQPYRVGRFTGFATAAPGVQAQMQKLSCATDSDCHGELGHPAASCVANQCQLASLFPLDGGSRRAFPAIAAVGGGRIAISGGFSVLQSDGTWAATKERVEVFDPTLGRFLDTPLQVDNFGVEARVGAADVLSWHDGSYVQVGGSSKLKLTVTDKLLTADLLDDTCAGTGAGCPLSKAIWRVDANAKGSSGTLLADHIALPIVARVASPNGPRVMVAGGVEPLIPKGGAVPRRGETLLCTVAQGSAECVDSAAKMATGRAMAAHACIETSADGCKRLLIVGGRAKAGSPLAELYNASKDAYEPVTVLGAAPADSHGGQLVRAGNRFYLLAAMAQPVFLEARSVPSAGALPPYELTVDDSGEPVTVSFAVVDLKAAAGIDKGQRAFASAIGFDDGSALLVGGLGAANKILADAILIGADAADHARIPLDGPRFAAGMARIEATGPLHGCVLLGGGITTESAAIKPQSHVEVYCPPAP